MFIPFDTQPELTPDNIIMAKTAHGDATINRTRAGDCKKRWREPLCIDSKKFPNPNKSISRSTFVWMDNLDNMIPGEIRPTLRHTRTKRSKTKKCGNLMFFFFERK
jgi:hypothetical protein